MERTQIKSIFSPPAASCCIILAVKLRLISVTDVSSEFASCCARSLGVPAVVRPSLSTQSYDAGVKASVFFEKTETW